MGPHTSVFSWALMDMEESNYNSSQRLLFLLKSIQKSSLIKVKSTPVILPSVQFPEVGIHSIHLKYVIWKKVPMLILGREKGEGVRLKTYLQFAQPKTKSINHNH